MTQKQDELDKAAKHCRRAIYDDNEAQLLYYFEEIKKFKNDYRKIVITDVIQSYSSVLYSIRKIQDDIKRIRLSDVERAEFYKKLSECVEALAQNYLVLDTHREELNKKIRKERWQVLGILAAVVSALGACVTVICALR